MWVAVLRLELAIPGARSLKDRRQVVRSLKERLISKFNVNCAEVDEAESWVRASLGVTACSNEKQYLEDLANEISRYAGQDPGAMLAHVDRDVFRYESEA